MTEYSVIVYGYPYVMGEEPKHLDEFDMYFGTLDEAKDYALDVKNQLDSMKEDGIYAYVEVWETDEEHPYGTTDQPIFSTWNKDEQETATDYIEQREEVSQMYQEEEQEAYASCGKKHKKDKKVDKKVKADEDDDKVDPEEMRGDVISELEYGIESVSGGVVTIPEWTAEIALSLLRK